MMALVVGFMLGVIVSTISLISLGSLGYSVESWWVVLIILLLGCFSGTTNLAVIQAVELSGLRAMKNFFWNHLSEAAFQNLVDESLWYNALEAKHRSDDLILLHRRGIGEEAQQGVEEEQFNTKKKLIESLFKDNQSSFYEKYDEIASFISHLGKGELRERSWKVYTERPPQVK